MRGTFKKHSNVRGRCHCWLRKSPGNVTHASVCCDAQICKEVETMCCRLCQGALMAVRVLSVPALLCSFSVCLRTLFTMAPWGRGLTAPGRAAGVAHMACPFLCGSWALSSHIQLELPGLRFTCRRDGGPRENPKLRLRAVGCNTVEGGKVSS